MTDPLASSNLFGPPILDAVKLEIKDASESSVKLAQLALARGLNFLIEIESYVAFMAAYGSFRDGKLYIEKEQEFDVQNLVVLTKECLFLADYIEPQIGKDISDALRSVEAFASKYRFDIGIAIENKAMTQGTAFAERASHPAGVQTEMLNQIKDERENLKKIFKEAVSAPNRALRWTEVHILLPAIKAFEYLRKKWSNLRG